jgi:large subunit ribosomal protein L4
MAISVIKADGTKGSNVNLPETIFGIEPNEAVVHQSVVRTLNNRRQGNSSTLGRTDVSGGGIKPWRQKGTGRARAGSIRSPLWPGGGTVFGPHPKSYHMNMPKKQRRLAIKSVLSGLAKEDRIRIVENLELPDHKTKNFAALLGKLELTGKKVLFLDEGQNPNSRMASRNIPGVKVTRARLANVKEILAAEYLVITLSGLKEIEEVFA